MKEVTLKRSAFKQRWWETIKHWRKSAVHRDSQNSSRPEKMKILPHPYQAKAYNYSRHIPCVQIASLPASDWPLTPSSPPLSFLVFHLTCLLSISSSVGFYGDFVVLPILFSKFLPSPTSLNTADECRQTPGKNNRQDCRGISFLIVLAYFN